MQKLILLAVVLLSACASVDEETAHCEGIDDDTARRACVERALAEAPLPGDNRGVGPPPCHPASTRPDPDRDQC